jgi:tRNA(fMet)-specific endonuclease VapC
MSLWILDTDHVSLLLEGNLAIQSRPQIEENVAITIVTAQEIFNGWVVKINSTIDTHRLISLYRRLGIVLQYFRDTEVLAFDRIAGACYDRLIREYPQLRKKRLQRDMRIAAIALSLNATLVTRNYRDFAQVPGLLIEDWTS